VDVQSLIEIILAFGSLRRGTTMADQQSPTLQPPGGGSTYDPMLEARVATLEADVRNIRDTLGEVKLDLREVRADLKNFRADMQSDLNGLRADMQSGFNGLRADMQSDIGELKSDNGDLKVNYATLSERIVHLPTKGYIGWWITLGLSGAVAALTILSRLGFLVAGAAK
jgi:hypothetical protein